MYLPSCRDTTGTRKFKNTEKYDKPYVTHKAKMLGNENEEVKEGIKQT